MIAVLVAALGIVNTLTVGVLERVREIGVLRASGMTRTQVRRTVVVEAGILGIVGAVLGIATGLIAAALLVVWAGAGRLDPRGPVAVDPRRRRPRRGCLDARGVVSRASGEPSRDRQRRPSRVGALLFSACRAEAPRQARGRDLGGSRRPMSIATPSLNRLPAAERGLTIADFLVPNRPRRADRHPAAAHRPDRARVAADRPLRADHDPRAGLADPRDRPDVRRPPRRRGARRQPRA